MREKKKEKKLRATGCKAGRNGAEIEGVASLGERGYEILRPLNSEERNPISEATLSLDDGNPKDLLFGKHKLNLLAITTHEVPEAAIASEVHVIISPGKRK